MGMTRREMLKAGALTVLGAGAVGGAVTRIVGTRSPSAGRTKESEADKWTREASYYERLEEGEVRCLLCPTACELAPGIRGACRVRENQGGVLKTLVYGRAASVDIDPVEKKPFHHLLPGSSTFSFSTAGCNMSCRNCHNWQLAQSPPERLPARDLQPRALVDAARLRHIPIITGTYAEPLVYAEYLLDVARLGNEHGLLSTMVTAGRVERRPLLDLCRELKAVKVDLKSMSEEFYRTNCGGNLGPVLDTIRTVKEQGLWLEIVYLVIPTLNDGDSEIKRASRWLLENVGPDVPLHFNRFHPHHRLRNLPPTPYETMDRCHGIARSEGVNFVYTGNLPGHPAESTYCPGCGELVLQRRGYQLGENHIQNGNCAWCAEELPGLWS